MGPPVVRGYRDLIVWQKAMRLFVGTCGLVRRLPYPERDDLGRQMRRAALSIPSNIAEGTRETIWVSFLDSSRSRAARLRSSRPSCWLSASYRWCQAPMSMSS